MAETATDGTTVPMQSTALSAKGKPKIKFSSPVIKTIASQPSEWQSANPQSQRKAVLTRHSAIPKNKVNKKYI